MGKNKIYYIGYYNGDKSIKRKECCNNIAASMKMDFVIKSLLKLGTSVDVISITIPHEAGWYPIEKVEIRENEKYVFLPVLRINLGKRTFFANKISMLILFLWGLKNLTKNDTVILYHALPFYPVVIWLKKIFNFRLIIQVEEIYSLAKKQYNIRQLRKEEDAISIGDAYLFVNDILPKRYANAKPFVVSYGNYTVFEEKQKNVVNSDNIGVVYTGIINEERGLFRIIKAIDYLPNNYYLHILGFGNEANVSKMKMLIEKINSKAGFERVKFYGTRTGTEYTKFLSDFLIGVSLMDSSENVSISAFPSKILAYLGHSLFVVSSKNQCILNSKIKDLLYLCDDDSPKGIAKTILSIDITKPNSVADSLRELEKNFYIDLKKLLFDI